MEYDVNNPEVMEFDAKSDFMSACISDCTGRGMPREQAIAVCLNKWRQRGGLQQDSQQNLPPKLQNPKDRIDIIADIKKLITKNKMTVSENDLLALLDKLQAIPGIPQTELQYIIDEKKLLILKSESPVLTPVKTNQSILALPRGKFYVITRNFKGWVNFDDNLFKNIIENYNNPDLSKPYIDKDHEEAESFGDIENPRIEKDGLHCDFILNEIGLELVKKGIYKYISPMIIDFETGKKKPVKNWMVTISLVNSPALLGAIPELQKQLELKLNFKRKEKNKMAKITLQNNFVKIIELSKNLGKPLILAGEITDPEAVATALPQIVELLQTALAQIKQLTGEKEIAETEMKTAQETATNLNTELTQFKKAQQEKEMEELMADAVKSGIYHPAIIELKKKQFIENPKNIKDEIEVLKKTINSNQTGQFTSTGSSDFKFTEEDQQIALSAGYDLTKSEDRKLFLKVKEDK